MIRRWVRRWLGLDVPRGTPGWADLGPPAAVVDAPTEADQIGQWYTVVNHALWGSTVEAWAREELSKALTNTGNPDFPKERLYAEQIKVQVFTQVANLRGYWSEAYAQMKQNEADAAGTGEEPLTGPKAADQWYEKDTGRYM